MLFDIRPRMKTINVGILGLGTVGAGTAETLLKQHDLIRDRSGIDVQLSRAADLNLDRDFGVEFPEGVLTQDARAVIQDPDIHIIVELIGGTGIAKTLILEALEAGKAVVTANKALLAEHGPELIAKAAEKGVDLFFEASVAGGIPIIKSLREGLVANPVNRICGILNGTCNYILTRMEREGVPFDEVLAEAQALGYAEAEPSLDVDGWDTAHKAVILAQLAFGLDVTLDEITVKGIRGMDAVDVQAAADLGYRIKLLAILEPEGRGIAISVQPVLIPLDHMLASVDMSFNAVLVDGEVVDETLYYGRGAGRLPTASAVVADIVDAARDLSLEVSERIPLRWQPDPAPQLTPRGEVQERSYLRLHLKDEPGTLGQVTRILGEHGISITAVNQKEGLAKDGRVPVLFLTGKAPVAELEAALAEFAALDPEGTVPLRYRVEELS